jgi:hypothetical protein
MHMLDLEAELKDLDAKLKDFNYSDMDKLVITDKDESTPKESKDESADKSDDISI